MNPAVSSLRNEPVLHQRLPTFERPSKRPRQNSIVHSRGPHASPPSELPSKYRKLADSRSLPLPPRATIVQNRVPISALLSLRPPGSPVGGEKPQLPKLSDVLLGSSHIPGGMRSETLSPLSLVSNQAMTSNSQSQTGTPLPKVMSTSPISTHLGTANDAPPPPPQMVPRLPAPVVNVPSGAKRKVIPCPYQFCQKKFSRNSNLKGVFLAIPLYDTEVKHCKPIAHVSNEYFFYSLLFRLWFAVHMRIHTKTYPFACNLCEREFMWSSSLHWHTKWHEKVAMKEAAKRKNEKGSLSSASTETNQGCTCTCVCPVHKTKPISMIGNGVETEKQDVLQARLNEPSTQ